MDGEYYEKDGKRYDRITKILDYFPHPDLVKWKLDVGKKEANRISKEALRIGTLLDAAVKADVLRQKIPKIKKFEVQNGFDAYLKWKEAYSPVLTVPETVFDDELMVAGTPDLTWMEKEEVIDLKGAARIGGSYWLQTEFYGRKLGLKRKAILRGLKQLGIYEYQSVPLNDEHWEAVKGAIKMYRYYQTIKEK